MADGGNSIDSNYVELIVCGTQLNKIKIEKDLLTNATFNKSKLWSGGFQYFILDSTKFTTTNMINCPII